MLQTDSSSYSINLTVFNFIFKSRVNKSKVKVSRWTANAQFDPKCGSDLYIAKIFGQSGDQAFPTNWKVRFSCSIAYFVENPFKYQL